jgi:hypothetical protein
MAFVSAASSRDPIDDVGELLADALKAARRVFAGPDGPLALALVLALAAMAEITLHADDVAAAMIANLLATLPLALVRRRLAWAAGLIVVGVLFAVAEGGAPTIAALIGLVTVLYLFAASHRRRWSVLLAFPFFVNAITPLSGEYAGFPEVLLLMLVVAAEALGDSRRERGAGRDATSDGRHASRPGGHGRARPDRARPARRRRPPRLGDRGPGGDGPLDGRRTAR